MKNFLSSSNGMTYHQEIKKETKIIKCKSCGAKNTLIAGKTKECEYCGTIYNLEDYEWILTEMK